MTAPLRVLCLDIEGGHGGSSRSLMEALAAVDREVIAPEVWCRRDGPVVERYRSLGIPTVIEPSLPKVSALPRLSRNIFFFALYARDFILSGAVRSRLAQAAVERFDVVHFNHEAFAGLAFWLRRKTRMPAVMHLRTNLVDTIFARAQQKLVSRAVDYRVFITPNEEQSYRRSGGTGPGRVIFNPVPLPGDIEPLPTIPRDGRLNIASLSNFSLGRGTDRLIDIARAMADRNLFRFVVAGDMPPDALPRDVAEAGLSDNFLFIGHVPHPERVLASCDVLIKPTREANPWGRDVLEAMAQGKPVLSCGTDQTFVESGVTGFLMSTFDATAAAGHLTALATDAGLLMRLGQAARPRIDALCNPARQASELAEVWQKVSKSARN